MLIRLKVRVTPNARKNEVTACTGDEIRLKVKAPAVDGKANAALIEYLAELTDVPRSKIQIKAGEKARIKVVELEGPSPEEVRARIMPQKWTITASRVEPPAYPGGLGASCGIASLFRVMDPNSLCENVQVYREPRPTNHQLLFTYHLSRLPFASHPKNGSFRALEMNYKETLNLPKTDFPMKANLTTREPEILAKWESIGLYEQIQERSKDAPLFVLHDGPPFANGDVHMGTALNKILKDLIVKSRSMAGYRAPYVPGWDCHGLPIEFKVVKESQGLSPLEVRERSEKYARKYIDIQRQQFRRLGVLGDWEHPYLTLDPGYESEILRVFAQIVERGLVYQSKKPVYWSTGAQTALAEAEVEYKERRDPSIYVQFPLTSGPFAGKASVAIWTTTPWTLAANVVVAVHPKITYVVQKFEHPETQGETTLLLAENLIGAFSETPVGNQLEIL